MNNDMTVMKYLAIIQVATFAFRFEALLSAGCDTGLYEEERWGPDLIILSKSVDGIKLGDTCERVEAIFGPPGYTWWADDVNKTWRKYSYPLPGLNLFISFLYDDEDRPLGAGRYDLHQEGVSGPNIRSYPERVVRRR